MSYVEKALLKVNELIKQCDEESEEYTDFVVIKQALEKQLTKKPNNFSNEHFVCPTCGEVTEFSCEGGLGKSNCSYCGQKIY